MNRSYLILFIFVLIVLLPSIFYSYFKASSMSLGLFFVLILFVYFLIISNSKLYFKNLNILLGVCILIFILVFSSFSFLFESPNFNYSRFFYSYFILSFMMVAASFFFHLIENVNDNLFNKTLNFIFCLLILDGIISGVFYQFFTVNKNLLLFAEPSHYALTLAPFVLYQIIKNHDKDYFFAVIILIVSLICFLLQSLILLVLILFCIFITLKKRLVFLTISLLTILVFTYENELTYFLDRVDFSGESNNLSVLVFLSGYERAFLSFKETFGLGLGLQQLGYFGPEGKYMPVIVSLTGFRVNYNDGGTLSSKIVSELGILGVFLLLFYLKYFIKYFFVFRNFLLSNKSVYLSYRDTKIFFVAVYLMMFLFLFVRGVGYFSGGTFLFVVSLFYLNNNFLTKKSLVG